MHEFILLILRLLIENMLELIALAVSIVAIILNLSVNKKANALSEQAIEQATKTNNLSKQAYELNKKVNSKEYEMFENMKFEVLKIIADLKAIDAKIGAPVYNGDDNYDYTDKIESLPVDYSQEIESLTKMQSSPGYLLLLHSIKDDNKRKELEETFRFLTMSSLKDVWVREWVHIIIDSLKENASFENALNMSFDNLVKELCDMKSMYTDYYVSDAKKENDKTKKDLVNILVINSSKINEVGSFKLRRFISSPYSDIHENSFVNRYESKKKNYERGGKLNNKKKQSIPCQPKNVRNCKNS